jgi:hypothetical protein
MNRKLGTVRWSDVSKQRIAQPKPYQSQAARFNM